MLNSFLLAIRFLILVFSGHKQVALENIARIRETRRIDIETIERTRVFRSLVAVGTGLAIGPPQRSVRAALLHTAPTLDDGGEARFRPRMKNAGRW
jgi:hypothetical protein